MADHFKGMQFTSKTCESAAGSFDLFPARALLVCSPIFGWVLAYFFDMSPWVVLTGGEADAARMFFFGGQLLGMFVGLSFMRRSNVRFLVSGFAAAASAAILVLRFLPGLRAGGWGFGLFGVLAGTGYGAMFHFWIFSFRDLPRTASIAAVHLAGGAVSLAILWAGERFGPAGAAAADVLVPGAAILAAVRMDFGRMDDPEKAELLPFPGRLIGIVLVVLLLMYFGSFLPNGLLGATNGGAWTEPKPGIRFLVSAAVYALFLVPAVRTHVLVLLYSAILLLLIGYGLIIVRAGDPSGPLVLVAADSIGNLFLFTLTFDIFHKHRRRPMIGAVFAGTVALGAGVGMLIGRLLEDIGRSDPGVFVGSMVIFYASALAFLPVLLKVLERELSFRNLLSPVTECGPGEGPADRDPGEDFPLSILDPSYIREPMGRKIRRLNQRFDPPYRLTDREVEIAALLAGRLEYDTIARKLSISINTLKAHAKSVYRKFDVPGRRGLIELCLEPDRPAREPDPSE